MRTSLNCSGCSSGSSAMTWEQQCCRDLCGCGTRHCGCLSSAAFSRGGVLKGNPWLVQGVFLTHIDSQL